ncbi:MAG: Xaa-Pro aminopeptidase [Elusimicrobia bacterium]|nr:Xaa-Pro aminopeptidase [Elusimicrobiota bacterium]
MFSPKTYVERRNKLKQQLKSGVVIMIGHDESPKHSDWFYDFKQDGSFLYFFGLNFAGLTGIIDIDENKDIIIGDELSIDDIVWTGSQPTLKKKSEAVGIYNTMPSDKLKDYVSNAVNSGRKIHFLPPYRIETKVKLSELLGCPIAKLPELVSIELIKAAVEQRSVKSEEEIAELERAVNATLEIQLALIKMARPGLTESYLIAETYKMAISRHGNVAFATITTQGQILHRLTHGNTLKKGDMVLCDCGVETDADYVGDLTTTFPVDKKFTPRQKEIYSSVIKAYNTAASLLKPGVKYRDVHLSACKTIAQAMKDIGLMKGNVDDAIAQGAYAMFMPHGIGHMIGLDMHDMEDYGGSYVGYDGQPKSAQFGLKSLRMARELKPGFVITVEPGIYFIPELIDLWKSQNKFKDFLNYDKLETYKDFGGIRNEEDYLITETGARRLGNHKPSTIEEIEALRG